MYSEPFAAVAFSCIIFRGPQLQPLIIQRSAARANCFIFKHLAVAVLVAYRAKIQQPLENKICRQSFLIININSCMEFI